MNPNKKILISDKITKKNKTVKELNVEFELLSERILKLEERNNRSDGKSDHEKIELILKQQDEKIEHLSKLLEEGNAYNLRKSQMNCKCNLCGKEFVNKIELKEHIKKDHPKNYKCNICNKNFEKAGRWSLT